MQIIDWPFLIMLDIMNIFFIILQIDPSCIREVDHLCQIISYILSGL